MAEIGRMIPAGKLEKYDCEIYVGKNILTSIKVQARSITEAIEIAAGALKIKPKKLYEDE